MQHELPIYGWDFISWTGAIACPIRRGWVGFTVVRVPPHPMSLGKMLWDRIARGESALDHEFSLHRDTVREQYGCSDSCEPHRVRWVYVISPISIRILAAVCFDSGSGMVRSNTSLEPGTSRPLVHHFRHVNVGTFSLRGPEPDWSAVARQVLHLKTGPEACPAQRIAL